MGVSPPCLLAVSPDAAACAGPTPLCLLQPRQQLDLYIPKSVSRGDAVPTVIFVTGGAWTIGYKAWGALLARRLCDAGVITMCLDYRNFPQVGPPQQAGKAPPVLLQCCQCTGGAIACSILCCSPAGACLAVPREQQQQHGLSLPG